MMNRVAMMLVNLVFLTSAYGQSAGDLSWYQHLGRSNGSASWANEGNGIRVGNGWDFRKVFAADDSVIYAITATGDLYCYQHLGRSNGSASWANGGKGIRVGSGWNFTNVFAADDGVIYAITATGDLYWYQHLGRSHGTANWANGGKGIRVGSGWNNFTNVFAASDGVIYAVAPNGGLYWYRHLGRSTGTASWANGGKPVQVGSGWNTFSQSFAADDGAIYGIKPSGDLFWYHHLGRSDGTATWTNGGQGIEVGSGWHFTSVFAANDSVIYAIK
jgi:hypothetical protein